VGTVTASNLLMRDAEWENEEFYWDFARKGNVFYQLGGVIVREQGVVGAVGLHRPKRAGGFSRRDITRLEGIIGHVRRAYHISRTLASFNATIAQLLDQSPQAVFLLDASSRPLMVNRAAERLLRAGDGIALEGGRLSCRPVLGWQRLTRLIHDAVQTGQGRGIHPGGAMAVGRPSGRMAYQVLVTPLRVPPSLLPGRPATACAAVYITDPEAHPPPPAAALAAWFNLTPAEARVARELADGLSPEEIAQAHRVSQGTVRVQMHAIFDKMDVKRQSQLVKKVLGLPHGWPEGDNGKG
jgi:DNA-binding CsgD family transcriptional regulator